MTVDTFHISGQSQHNSNKLNNDCRDDFASAQVKINKEIKTHQK